MLRRCVATTTRSATVRPTVLPLPVCSGHHHHLLAVSTSCSPATAPVLLWSRHVSGGRPSGRPIQQAAREAHAESLAAAAAAALAARESKSDAASKSNIAAMLSSLVMNNKIPGKEVRLVHEGITRVIPIELALDLAAKHGLDLIQVVEGPPPVCRLLEARSYLVCGHVHISPPILHFIS